MIVGFEKYAAELSEFEKETILPDVVRTLQGAKGEDSAITNLQICSALSCDKYTLQQPRVRKMINYIRNNGLIYNLISTSKGYYIATCKSECERYLESLDQRINSIMNVRDAMEYQLENKWQN